MRKYRADHAEYRWSARFNMMMKMKQKNKHRPRVKRGFSLPEAVIATVILVAAAAGVLLPYTSGAMIRAEGRCRTLAAKLASDLMEQVKNEQYQNIVPNYNYTEDYGKVEDAAGNIFSDPMYDSFARKVTTQYVNVSQEKWWSDNKYILATVKVYYKGNEVVCLNRLITKFQYQYHVETGGGSGGEEEDD